MSVRKFSSASISGAQPKGSKFWNQETFPGTYESIVTAIVDSNGASSITFSNIPQNYTHLQIRGMARTNRASNNDGDVLILRFNGDSNNNYPSHRFESNGESASGNSESAAPHIVLNRFPCESAASTVFGALIIDILDYKSTSKNKTTRAFCGYNRNGAGFISLCSGLYNTTPSAITSILLGPGAGTLFTQNSYFALYGIRGA